MQQGSGRLSGLAVPRLQAVPSLHPLDKVLADLVAGSWDFEETLKCIESVIDDCTNITPERIRGKPLHVWRLFSEKLHDEAKDSHVRMIRLMEDVTQFADGHFLSLEPKELGDMVVAYDNLAIKCGPVEKRIPRETILNYVFRFVYFVGRLKDVEFLAPVCGACRNILEREMKFGLSVHLAYLFSARSALSLRTNIRELVLLQGVLRRLWERVEETVLADRKMARYVLTGMDMAPERPPPPDESEVIYVAYTRYRRKLVPGARVARRQLEVFPFGDGRFEDRTWVVEEMLSFVGMFPQDVELQKTKDHHSPPRPFHAWRIVQGERKIGVIRCRRSFDNFEMQTRWVIPWLFQRTNYVRSECAHMIAMNPWARNSKAMQHLKAYVLRYMSRPQAILHGLISEARTRADPQSLIDFLKNTTGQKKVCFGKNQALISLVWVCPWAKSVIRQMSYFILDASFYALKPYVYCVPQGVFCNTSIPLGLVVATGETTALYELFYEALDDETQINLRKKICITDEGQALSSFLSERGIRQVLCHRHLIQTFGANGIMGALARLLLKTGNEEAYRRKRQYTNAVISRLLQQERKVAKLDKYCEMTGQYIDDDGVFTDTGNESALNKWALWRRESVANTTNHAESFHATLNKLVCPKRKKFGFLRSLSHVVASINDKQSQWIKYAERNLKEALRKVSLVVQTGEETDCDCRSVREMSRRWNCEQRFPCVHTLEDRRQGLFEKFREDVIGKLKSFQDEIKMDPDAPVDVCYSDAIPQFSAKQDGPLAVDAKKMELGRRELRPLTEQERQAVKLGVSLFPCFKSRLRIEVVMQICRTVINENIHDSPADLFIKCHDSLTRRYQQSRH